jgi:hypothetical protein
MGFPLRYRFPVPHQLRQISQLNFCTSCPPSTSTSNLTHHVPLQRGFWGPVLYKSFPLSKKSCIRPLDEPPTNAKEQATAKGSPPNTTSLGGAEQRTPKARAELPRNPGIEMKVYTTATDNKLSIRSSSSHFWYAEESPADGRLLRLSLKRLPTGEAKAKKSSIYIFKKDMVSVWCNNQFFLSVPDAKSTVTDTM